MKYTIYTKLYEINLLKLSKNDFFSVSIHGNAFVEYERYLVFLEKFFYKILLIISF